MPRVLCSQLFVISGLQEYVQAEKKKNSKTSSTKEGKFLSSSTQIEGKSTEQLPKSTEMISNRAVDTNLLDGNPSPSLTPWGSRSASPYPSLDTDEALTGADMEVLHVTSGFRPIQNVEKKDYTPGDSPSEGILPVGGVVKGHSLPSQKSEPLSRGKLQKNYTAGHEIITQQAFVVMEPKTEELPDTKCEAERVKELSEMKVPPGVNMADSKELSGDKRDSLKEHSDDRIPVGKEPFLKGDGAEGPSGKKVVVIKEPSEVVIADGKELSSEKMDSVVEPYGVKDDIGSEPVADSKEEIKTAPITDSGDGKRSHWCITEGASQDFRNKEIAEGKPSTSQGQISSSSGINPEEPGNTQQKTVSTCVGKIKPFTPGHRRVASSPLSIAGSSFDSRAFLAGENTCGMSYLERSRSDSDISAHVKQPLDESLVSADSIVGSLYGDQIDANSQVAKEDVVYTSEPKGAKESLSQSLRKATTLPSALYKRTMTRSQSWVVNQWQATAKRALPVDGDSDAAPSDGATKRGKVKRIVSSFMSSTAYQPVASTFPSHEHHLLPPGEKVLVVVSEKETSSIIAYTLSTTEYNERLHEIQRTLSDIKNEATQLAKFEFGKSGDVLRKGQTQMDVPFSSNKFIRVDSGSDSGEGFVHLDLIDPEAAHGTGCDEESLSVLSSDNLEFMSNSLELKTDPDHYSKVDKVKYTKIKQSATKDDTKKTEGSSAQDWQGQDDIDLVQFGFQRKDATKEPVDFHVKHQFADNTCRFYCSIYYAEQFRLLRKRIFPDGEEKYIRSLQHSVAWGARGGKSGSAFFKTLDDRFVMKQMSRQELQCFLEFAPHYFCYVNKALDEQRPTLLAKILGIYRIGYKNSQSGATMRQDVLVMENLFYDRKIDKTFDLKGSMRSRYVQTSGMKNDVLLDENLLEMIRERPIFFRPHSKAILSRAIHTDTEFLAQQMVMDYSLLVGIDEARSELVTGIIDFIRTFTWDKKLEMYVKASGILGGQGRMPTVVSPELYRTRFTEAMHRYFLMVPDKWTGLGNDLD